MSRDNFLYIVVGLVAVALIGITIGLQIVIMMNRSSEASPGLNQDTAQSLSERVIEALQEGRTSITSPTATLALPTATPIPPTSTPPEPTDTAIPPTAIPTTTPTTEPPASIVEQAPIPTVQATADVNVSGKQRLLSAENLTISADDNLVLDIVKNSPYAIGFVGRAYYRGERDAVRALHIELSDGRIVGPSPDAVFDGAYPISRLLYVYSTVDIIQNKPEVAAFLGCYLRRINEEILDIGFFPVRRSLFNNTLHTYNAITGNPNSSAIPVCNANVDGNIEIAGSTTVAPVTQRMSDLFIQQGYNGDISIDAIGTGSGFDRFCGDGLEDIINADRQITETELASCRAIGREPIAFAIGEDALSVIVSVRNNFVDTISMRQLQRVFSDARFWADVDPAWPQELIGRATPNQTGGTFATFVARVFDTEQEQIPAMSATTVQDPSTHIQTQVPTELASVSEKATPANEESQLDTVTSDADLTRGDADLVLGVSVRTIDCQIVTSIVADILIQDLALTIETRSFDTPEALFDSLADGSTDVTFCYIDPNDRTLMRERLGAIRQFGIQYFVGDGFKLQTWANGLSKAELRSDSPCLYDFLEKVSFEGRSLPTQQSTDWRQQYADNITTWLTCPYDR